MSNTGKTFAQLRGDILADIEAVRMGRMPAATAGVIFQGYKVVTDTINTEIAAAKFALNAQAAGHQFGKIVGLGKRIVNEEDDGEKTKQIAA